MIIWLLGAAAVFYAAIRSKRQWLLLVGLGLVVLGATAPKADNTSSEPAPRSQYSVRDIESACHAKVRDELLSPSSAKYGNDFYDTSPEWNPTDRSWSWSFSLEASNAFGVMLPSTWRCRVVDDNLISVEQVR